MHLLTLHLKKKKEELQLTLLILSTQLKIVTMHTLTVRDTLTM